MDKLTYYDDLKRKLEDLRRLFAIRESGLKQPGYLDHFDESLSANEFEIALHALCDFLMEPTTDPVSRSDINELSAAHSLMELNDDCVERLGRKLAGQQWGA